MSAEPATWKALIVACGRRRLALRLRDVAEVCRAQPISSMPGVPAPVVGICMLRGQAVPVVDLGQLVGDGAGEHALFVTVRLGSSMRVAALAVGEVIGIRDLPEALDELPPLVADSGAAGIAAVTRLDGELVEVLRHGRLVPPATWAILAARAS